MFHPVDCVWAQCARANNAFRHAYKTNGIAASYSRTGMHSYTLGTNGEMDALICVTLCMGSDFIMPTGQLSLFCDYACAVTYVHAVACKAS